MTDHADRHAPTTDFADYLARDITRTLRHEARVGPSTRSAVRTRRLGLFAASVAGIAATLLIGLVWGVGTGYAAAHVQDGSRRHEAFPLAVVRSMPVRTVLSAMTCGAATTVDNAGARVQPTQQEIPILDLPTAVAKTPETLGAILGMRQVTGGNVLVSDPLRHQLRLLDSTLATVSIAMDSIPGSARSYGPRPRNLIPYVGDSSLVADFESRTLLVLNARGEVARALAPLGPLDIGMTNRVGSAADPEGRLLTRMSAFPSAPVPGMSVRDSALIVRADFELRRLDTVGTARDGSVGVSFFRDDDGKTRARMVINPLPAVDSWAVLADGSIAFVRGSDYHIDWVHPDGTKSSTPKLPFDFKPLTDEDKQRLIDSARTADAVRATQRAASVAPAGDAAGGRGGGAPGGSAIKPPAPEFVPLKDMPDYYPAVRTSSAIADADGNLWILPTTSARSRNGELVYDVVNLKGELVERVRLPLGRSVAGFGKGGVVYMMTGDRTNGFYLERTALPRANPR